VRDAWDDHLEECNECGDWYQGEQVRELGANPSAHPCVHLAYRVTYKCKQHDDPWECPDAVIVYSAKFCEYGIPIRDGGTSRIDITICPWCGIALPHSKRDEWFSKLEALGYEDPWSDDIPEEFQSDAWWRG